MLGSFAIILIFLHLSSAKHEALTKINRYPNKELILTEQSFDNTTLYYALCDQPPKQCTIVQEIHPFRKTTATKTCEVNLDADNVQLLVGSCKKKAILITYKTSSKALMLKASIVDISSCKALEIDIVEVPLSWAGHKLYHNHIDVVVFKKNFDVIIKGLGSICSKDNQKVYCSFTFDFEGKKIEGPAVWPKMAYDEMDIVSPILPAALKEWYFFVRREDALFALLVDRKGGPVYEKMYKMPKQYLDTWKEGYSNTNNAHGMCYDLMNSTIGCWQMGVEGHRLITDFIFKHQHKTTKLSVHNLRDGGLVILMVACPNQICSGVEDKYHLIKVDARGKMVGHIDVKVKSECDSKAGEIITKVFENEQGQYCTIRMCKRQIREEAQLDAFFECYSDKDFTN